MRILVTGTNGRIGQGFCEYIKESKDIFVENISLRGDKWTEADISGFDAVYYCIGIVDEQSTELYTINEELPRQFAQKAKLSGIKKFVFLSSMAVYDYNSLAVDEEITADTVASPKSRYGDSKLNGEKAVFELADDSFHVHIIRAPSIYGRGTEAYLDWYESKAKKGKFIMAFNYQKRSAIYIDNLSELVYLICATNLSKEPKQVYYYPQNKDRYSVSEFVRAISIQKQIPCKFIKLPIVIEKILKNKRFGKPYRAIAYEKKASDVFDYMYDIITTEESIKKTLNVTIGVNENGM